MQVVETLHSAGYEVFLVGGCVRDLLLNRRSTTWRSLSKAQKESEGAAKLQMLVDHPTLIKRPVFVDGKVLAVGFSPVKLLPIIKGMNG